MRAKVFILTVLLAVFFLVSLSYSEVPQMINYQGKITTPQGALIDTVVSIRFCIYADPVTLNPLWTETQSSVKVDKGIFSVLLGSLTPIPDSVFEGGLRYLGVKVGNDAEMTPRKAITSVGYAIRSAHSDTAEYARSAPAMPDDDWVVDGDNIYHLDGNVGIGTTNLQAALQVGEGTFSVFRIPVNRVGIDDQNPQAKLEITPGPTGMDLFMLSSAPAEDGNLFIVKNDGRVGIGTNVPGGYKLRVLNQIGSAIHGDCEAAGPYHAVYGKNLAGGNMGAAVYGQNAGANNRGYGVLGANMSSTGWAGYFIGPMNYFSGSVGIGTTTPHHKLVIEESGKGLFVRPEPESDAVVLGYTRDPGNDMYNIRLKWPRTEFNNQAYFRSKVGIGTESPGAKLDVRGTLNVGAEGEGYDVNFFGFLPNGRMFWDEYEMALRAGMVSGDQWDPPNIGAFSIATGYNTMAKGQGSIAMGIGTTAIGHASTAIGSAITAQGSYSFGIGLDATPRTITQDHTMAIMGGNVGIGTTSPTYRLELPNIASTAGRGRANQWVTYSSREEKTEIAELGAKDYAAVLKEILEMDLVYYRYKNQEDDRRYLGVVAEEAPEQVVTSDRKGLSLSEFATFAIAGLKAQQAEIEQLKKEIEMLRKGM